MVGYNGLARWYDNLQSFVFGDKLISIQSEMLAWVSPGDKVLFVGGGTGKVLSDLLEKKPISIDFLELSENMLSIAQARTNEPNYIHADVLEYEGKEYDCVLLFFVLDVFNKEDLNRACERILKILKPGGLVLYADFQSPQTIYHKVLLWMMIRFFKVTTDIGSTALLNHSLALRNTGFYTVEKMSRQDGFIAGEVLRK